jgi:hypothetical protein
MLPHGLEVSRPVTNVTKSSSYELKSLVLIARLRCFARTSRTLRSGDPDLLHQSHHVAVALLKIATQLIDNIAHPPQLLILPLQLPLEFMSQTALNLPHNVSRLHLGAGLCCQSTCVLRSLRLQTLDSIEVDVPRVARIAVPIFETIDGRRQRSCRGRAPDHVYRLQLRRLRRF